MVILMHSLFLLTKIHSRRHVARSISIRISRMYTYEQTQYVSTEDRYVKQPHTMTPRDAPPPWPALGVERDDARIAREINRATRMTTTPGSTRDLRTTVGGASPLEDEDAFQRDDAEAPFDAARGRDDDGDYDGRTGDDGFIWTSFAEDADPAMPARNEAEVRARDEAFESALERARAARRALARRSATEAGRAKSFYEDEVRFAREEAFPGDGCREDGGCEDEAGGEDVAAARGERANAWRGDFSSFEGAPARAPRPLPEAWTAPHLNVDLEDDGAEFRREAMERAALASAAAEESKRQTERISEMAQSIRRLTAALSACERREAAAEMSATAEAERAAALEHQCIEAKARLKSRESDISELNKVMFVLKKRVEDLTDALDDARRNDEKYRMEIAELKVNDSELKRAVEKRAVSERMAYNANEQTKRDVLALQSKCRMLEEENERLNARVKEMEGSEFEARKSAQRFHQLAETSARETEILQRANDSCAAESEDLRRQLNEAHRELTDLKIANGRRSREVVPPVKSNGVPAQHIGDSESSGQAATTKAVPVAPPVPTQRIELTRSPPRKVENKKNVVAHEEEFHYEHFDDSEYKRRMRDGSGFFYDMRGLDAPAAKPKPKGRAKQPVIPPGSRYVPPLEPIPPTVSYDEWMERVSALEHEHMMLALERDAIEAELTKLPAGAGRNMLERERKARAVERLHDIHTALKDNNVALKAIRDARGGR